MHTKCVKPDLSIQKSMKLLSFKFRLSCSLLLCTIGNNSGILLLLINNSFISVFKHITIL